jgi:hypothetical protein
MKRTLVMILVLGLAASGCGKKPAVTAKATNSPPAADEYSNPLNAPAQYLGALNQAQKLATKTVDSASVNQAIQMFYSQEERYPKDLQELVVQHFLPAIPKEPYGMRFYYNPQTGQFLVL